MSLDDEIDDLYRLAPETFTAARNALAKRAGARAAEIKRLVKPAAAAWAVNQIYWRRRAIFDALAKASAAMRTAHVRQLSGKSADVALADARQRAALDAAFEQAAAFLKEAGDSLSPATIHALTRTLEAIPSSAVNGRLTKPLEPVGFGVLASLMSSGGDADGAPADVVVMKRRGHAEDVDVRARPRAHRRDEAQKAAADERRAAQARERARLNADLAAARTKERGASEALASAQAAAQRASRRVDELDAELVEARQQLATRRADADRARADANEAASARLKIERELQKL